MLSSFVLLYCVDSSLPVWIMAYQFYSPFEPINFLTMSIGRGIVLQRLSTEAHYDWPHALQWERFYKLQIVSVIV